MIFTFSESLIAAAALWSDWNTKVMDGVSLLLRDSLVMAGLANPWAARRASKKKDIDIVW
jgi:hypothetical protein